MEDLPDLLVRKVTLALPAQLELQAKPEPRARRVSRVHPAKPDLRALRVRLVPLARKETKGWEVLPGLPDQPVLIRLSPDQLARRASKVRKASKVLSGLSVRTDSQVLPARTVPRARQEPRDLLDYKVTQVRPDLRVPTRRLLVRLDLLDPQGQRARKGIRVHRASADWKALQGLRASPAYRACRVLKATRDHRVLWASPVLRAYKVPRVRKVLQV